MNKLLRLTLFISFIFFYHLTGLKAQITYCPDVTVEAFPLNPQMGNSNYFGVRVTLSHAFTHDVTVTGFIYNCCEDHYYNENNPFSLTIGAGYTENETSPTFYQTTVVFDATVTVTSISYCPSDTIAVVSNSSNTYDYIGVYHNEGMSSIRGLLDPNNPAPDYGTPSLVCPYLNSLGYDTTIWKADYAAGVNAGYLPFTITPGMDTLGNELYSMSMIGSAANGYLQMIYDTVVYYLNTETPSEATYDAFAYDLVSIELSISNSGSLSSTEKMFLLSACSVARYSAEYWANDINNAAASIPNRTKGDLAILYHHAGNYTEPFGPAPPLFEKYLGINEGGYHSQAQYYKWPKWLKIVARDIIGAVTGGITGHIPGAIAGGISGSATEFIAQQ